MVASHGSLEGLSEHEIIKIKVGTVGRMQRIYKNLIENQDLLFKIKMVNDGRIPRGLLLEGKVAIRNCLKEFELAKNCDRENEKRPLPRGSVLNRASASDRVTY